MPNFWSSSCSSSKAKAENALDSRRCEFLVPDNEMIWDAPWEQSHLDVIGASNSVHQTGVTSCKP